MRVGVASPHSCVVKMVGQTAGASYEQAGGRGGSLMVAIDMQLGRKQVRALARAGQRASTVSGAGSVARAGLPASRGTEAGRGRGRIAKWVFWREGRGKARGGVSKMAARRNFAYLERATGLRLE